MAVIALAYGAGALMDSGQTVGLRILDMEFTLGPVQAIIAFGVFLVGLWLVLKALSLSLALLRFMNGDETAIRRFFHAQPRKARVRCAVGVNAGAIHRRFENRDREGRKSA